ncbi:MAG: type II secretion system F family protein [bacterium]
MKFDYQARTREGQVQAGVIEASSKEAALNVLQGSGVYVTFLEPAEDTLYTKRIRIFKGSSRKEMVIFTRQLAILFKSSVPVTEALRTLAIQTKNDDFKKMIDEIAEKIEGGTTLSQAMAMYPDNFSAFYIGMVKSGEASGRLSDVLEYLADHMERDYNFYLKVVMAMIYPFFVGFVFIAVIILMITFVIPQLSQVLKETGEKLPWVTERVIGFSDYVTAHWMIIIFAFVAIAFLVFRLIKSREGKAWLSDVSLKVPLLGDFIKKIYLTRMAENLSTLISSGLPIIQALEITEDVLGNQVYKNIVAEIREEVKKGESISSVLAKHPQFFPPLFVQMVVVGERTGKLESTLLSIVSFFQKDVERTLDSLIGLLEPIMIIGLGLLVLGLMGSVLLPVYQIGMGS